MKLWKPDGTLVKTLEEHKSEVLAVSFSPDGDSFLTADNDGYVRIWSKDGTLLKSWESPYPVFDVAFSPDGRLFASASGDGTVKIWSSDISLTNNLIETFQGHRNLVSGVSFSQDSDTIVTASHDKTVRLWSTKSTLITSLDGHPNEALDVSFSPNGKTLASVGQDNQVKLWDRQGTLIKSWDGQKTGWGVTFSPDGEIIASFSDKEAILWNLDGSLRTTLSGHSDRIWSVSFSPDGKTIASASQDKTVRLWQRDGTPIKVLEDNSQEENSYLLSSVSFSPDEEMIATASGDIIKLWNKDGILLTTLTGHSNEVTRVNFSPNSEVIATASLDKTVNLWNRDGKLITTLQGHQDGVWGLTFSPDGKIIATASGDKTIKLWNLDGKLLSTLQGHNNAVWNLSFSPDGKTLASAGLDGKIILWDVDLDLDKIMIGACHWVGDYLKNNPQVQESDSSLCDGVENDWNAEGEDLARSGDLQGAIAKFQKAQAQNSSLELNPEKKAKQLAATAQLQQGETLAVQGKVEEAIAAYKKAQEINPELKISAESWKTLCWDGSKHGFAREVLFACTEAVKLAPEDGQIRDSRGLARLFVGDNTGAIEDFQAYVTWWDANKNNEALTEVDKERMQKWSQRRQRWIKELKAGKKFTPEEIKQEMELLWKEE